jgi:hypothetical protein
MAQPCGGTTTNRASGYIHCPGQVRPASAPLPVVGSLHEPRRRRQCCSYRRHPHFGDTSSPQNSRLFHTQKGRPATGRPFSMGGSSNGGKAIGTLWSKSMFDLWPCQERFPSITTSIFSNNLRGNLRFRASFSGFLPQNLHRPAGPLHRPVNLPFTPAARTPPACSAVPGAGSGTPAQPPPVCPAKPAPAPAHPRKRSPASAKSPSRGPTAPECSPAD